MEQPSTVWRSQKFSRHRVHRTIQSESCTFPGRHASQCPCIHGNVPYNLAIQEETAAVWGSFETAKSSGASLYMCMLEPIWKDGQPMNSTNNPKFKSSRNSAIQCLEAPGIQNTKVTYIWAGPGPWAHGPGLGPGPWAAAPTSTDPSVEYKSPTIEYKADNTTN